MREVFKFKKSGIFKWTAAFVLGLVMLTTMSTQTYAAPKQMPDGNVFDAEFYAETYEDVKHIPNTSTGHVRRELKEKIDKDYKYKRQENTKPMKLCAA